MDNIEKELNISELLEIGKLNISALNPWEKTFFYDIINKHACNQPLTPKQESCLRKIVTKVESEIQRIHEFSGYQKSHLNKLRGLK